MTGQNLFQIITLSITVIMIILHFKRKIKLFCDDTDKDFLISIIFLLALLGGFVITLIWFIENWKTQIL